MFRNIRRAMAVMFGLALSAAMGFQASAQDEDPMQDVTQDEPVVESVAEDYGKGCGKGCGDDCCGGGSFYGEFQFLYLEAYSTEEDIDSGVDSEDGYRIVGGYTGCDGLGVRARYFDYDGIQEVAGSGTNGLDVRYFDAEVTDAICICNLHGVLSAGYRHGEYESFEDDDLDVDFEGDGVTLGIVLNRQIGCNLGLYAWVQHSILYGDDDESGDDDVLTGWTEVQLGAQYDVCVGGYDAFVRGGVEADRFEGLQDDDTADAGLLGWFLSAGVGF